MAAARAALAVTLLLLAQANMLGTRAEVRPKTDDVLGASTFNLSNTLGSGMVLQRSPKSAVVWGMGRPGVAITTTFIAGSNRQGVQGLT